MTRINQDRVTPDNIVRISSEKDVSRYIHAIARRGQPDVYKKYGCIRLRFTKDLEYTVRYLCRFFWNFGLVVKEKIKMKGGIPCKDGVIISKSACEIKMVKIPQIVFENNEEFDEWWSKHSYEEEVSQQEQE